MHSLGQGFALPLLAAEPFRMIGTLGTNQLTSSCSIHQYLFFSNRQNRGYIFNALIFVTQND